MGLSNCKITSLNSSIDSITIVTKDPTKYASSVPKIVEFPTIDIPDPPPILEPKLNPVSIQGELQKFQPECKTKYISRWVQLTPTELKYFKNEYSSCFYWNKPLSLVPLTEIHKIKLLSDSNQHKFEIILKKEIIKEKKIDKNSEKIDKGVGKSEKIGEKNNKKMLRPPINSDKLIFMGKDLIEIEKWVSGFCNNGVRVKRINN